MPVLQLPVRPEFWPAMCAFYRPVKQSAVVVVLDTVVITVNKGGKAGLSLSAVIQM